ncbi:MAG: cupredoxin domain-containing protein [Actinobacteria bacterium]|nr:cupredoxin domain-containing protein [Actinomycetota bacterium]
MSIDHHAAARLGAALLLVSAVFLGAACGGSEDPESASSAGTKVTTTEFEFSEEVLTLASGDTLELVNDGTVEHDITIEEADMMVHVAPGETASATLNIEPGDYIFYCSIPGHREAGMEGTLTIE